MIHNVYAVFDTKANAFLAPAMMQTDEQAIRQFASATVDDNHAFTIFPDDYILYNVGTWNDEDARYTNAEPPHVLMNARQAHSLLPKEEN